MYANYKTKADEVMIDPSIILIFTPSHTCNVCKKVWRRAPATAIVTEMGIWWNCHCKSTMTRTKNIVSTGYSKEANDIIRLLREGI